jgi:redox-sensitive bicupin YhaK (pirin superfamily)
MKMITTRPGNQRGSSKFSWLDSRHTFSFGDYYDPKHMGFSDLRVINEDRVDPGAGFPTHSHRDMEIITYVLEGALAHKDSTGTSSVIRIGDVQRMSAGTGISHSEYNASKTEAVHFLQIWIEPEREGLKPGYEQRAFPQDDRRGRLRLVASRDGGNDSVTIHQDVKLYDALLSSGDAVSYELKRERHAWLQIIKGALAANETLLRAGDGAAVSHENELEIRASEESEILLFDLK